MLRSPALQHIHYMFSYTLSGCDDSTRIVSHRDFDFLLSMVDGFYLYLCYEVVVSISHQGISPCIGALFVGPYITHVIRHMALLPGTNRIRIVGGFAAMVLKTVRSMGMLHRVQTARRIDYLVP